MERVTLLVNSCDAYADLWDPFFTLLKRYWAPLTPRILLNTETKDYQFDGLPITCVHHTGPYGARMLHALAEVKTEYVVTLLDDFFLRQPVRLDRLEKILGWMDADPDIVYFTMDCTRLLRDWERDRYPGYRRAPVGSRYILNMQGAVWRTAKLAGYWRPDVSPWEWEEYTSLLTLEHPEDKFYCAVDNDSRFLEYGFTMGQWMGIQHGKWVEEDVVPLFEKEGIRVDFTKRGFVSRDASLPPAERPASRRDRYDQIARCLGRRYWLPYFLFCRRCNLYTRRHGGAVDENYFHYLQRKADTWIETGRKPVLGALK